MINFKSPKILYFAVVLTFVVGGFVLYKNAQNSQNPVENTENIEVQPPITEVEPQQPDKSEQPTNPENTITISLNGLPENLKNLKFTDQYQKEYYEKAIKAEEGIQKDPKNYQNYNSAGLWWKGLGDLMHPVILSEEKNPNPYYNRAIEIYSFAGKLFESKKVYQPYQNLANVYIILGNYTKAEEAMKEAIRLATEVGELYVKLAELYSKDYMNAPSQKIIDLYESALHQESYQPDVIYPAYAQYLCSIGKQQEALEKTKINCSSFE